MQELQSRQETYYIIDSNGNTAAEIVIDAESNPISKKWQAVRYEGDQLVETRSFDSYQEAKACAGQGLGWYLIDNR